MLNTIDNFNEIYLSELGQIKHLEIVRRLYEHGRVPGFQTRGLESETGASPFPKEQTTIRIDLLWLFRYSEGKPITKKEMSKYLGINEDAIRKCLNRCEQSPIFNNLIDKIKNGCVSYICSSPESIQTILMELKSFPLV